MFELAATAILFPRHRALKYMTSLATPLATVVAVAVATNSDTVLVIIHGREKH